ncbi:MAG: pyridoxal-phosphate-dependent aminotransferase family protein [Oscillospiraceae bacterium]|jgi:alanine-glyoxylate transaminase/serine-glyoxylate transaminase/serine-pyruvate transaminase
MKNYLDDIQSTLLLGAGPSGVAPSTYNAISRTMLGHMDPYFLQIMAEIKHGLRALMNTENKMTLPLSGTGSIGMEAAFVNTVERGDKVLILENGVFGNRMEDVASRLGAVVTKEEFEWGTPVRVERVKELLAQDQYKIVAIVHAETSTGVCNPVEEIGQLVHESGALYLVDTVTSLGGIPVEIDKWKADVVYSGTQKCLSCPPGAAPISFSDAAMEVILNRKTPVPNWYLDMSMLAKYWTGETRIYHHTAPISMMYALYQSVYNILEEGTENVFARHQAVHERLVAGLEELGLEMLVEPAYRLPELNAVKVPEGIDEKKLRADLLSRHHIEISGGLGALAGKVIRIGLMGYNATPENVDHLLDALRDCLALQKNA